MIYLTSSAAAEVAGFLRSHPPFDTLDDEALAAVAAAAHVERHAAGTAILRQATPPSAFAYVVCDGAVELMVDGRVLDQLGVGEMFGYASMLAEAPIGFTIRAGEDTILVRLPEETIRPVLQRPSALAFVVRALGRDRLLLAREEHSAVADVAGRSVRELIRGAPLVCPPALGVRDAARRMVEAQASCVVVELADGVGIVTDHDLRERVVAAGAGPETPLRAVMTAPARTVAADRAAPEALIEMLDHGVRHLPVLDAHRRLVGVVDDVDLMAAERRAPFHLRAQIARAGDIAGAARAAAGLGQTVIALYDAGLPAPGISRVMASIHDALTRRLVELAEAELGRPPVPYTWLALGSFARREPFPGSDADNALAWEGEDDPEVRRALLALAERVLAGLAAAGLRPDTQGAVASSPLFARPVAAWERAAEGWLDDPDRDRGLMLLSVLLESTPVRGPQAVADRLAATFARGRQREATLRRLAVAALDRRPPTGFLRGFVLEDGGERKGVLDIKRGGLLPIVNLARWSALSAGVAAASTSARLDAAEGAGALEPADAAVLRDAFELVSALRMEHQVARLRAGLFPDDLIDPTTLTRLTRNSLKEAFRAVARVQRGIAVTLGLSAR